MNEIEYYLILDDKEQGPFTIGQLRSLWNAGKITGKTCYFQAGMTAWEPMAQILSRLEPPPIKDTAPRTIKTAKSRFVYIILGIFLGPLGIHNFYAGYFRKGVTQIIVWVVGVVLFLVAVGTYSDDPAVNFELKSRFSVFFLLSFFIGFLLLLWALIRIITDLITTKTDASGDPLV